MVGVDFGPATVPGATFGENKVRPCTRGGCVFSSRAYGGKKCVHIIVGKIIPHEHLDVMFGNVHHFRTHVVQFLVGSNVAPMSIWMQNDQTLT